MLDPRAMADHPINVLNRYAANAYGAGDVDYGDHYSTAATRLSAEEIQTGVVYVVADREALKAVQEAYVQFTAGRGDDQYVGGEALADAIRDLLGMDDS